MPKPAEMPHDVNNAKVTCKHRFASWEHVNPTEDDTIGRWWYWTIFL